MKDLKKLPINLILSFGILIMSAIAVTLLSFILQPNSFLDVLRGIKNTPAILLYNLLPIFLLIFFFYFVSNNVWIGTLLGSGIITLLSIINRYKIIYRDDPLVPMDITVGTEALSIVRTSKLSIDTRYILLLVFIILVHIVLILYTKRKKLHIAIRMAGVILCISIAIMSQNKIYASKEIYNSIPVQGKLFLVSNSFNSKGFVYCFLYNISAYKMDVPQDYNEKEIKELIAAYSNKATTSDKTPHVIMIMGEAFSDISNNENLNFTEENDPLRFYNQLKSENLINGHIITPAFGGGTANTEFDSLTGCSTVKMSSSSTTAYRFIRTSYDAIPRSFEEIGYSTLGIHPGFSWFYNRENVYSYFGFDKTVFEDDFIDPIMKGNFISEESTVDRIITEFKDYIETGSEKPLFEFCVTIQNHNPYLNYKYGGASAPTYTTDLKLTAEANEFLTNYFIGIKDADKGIETLVNYFKSIDEPVILVYYGDHLPTLGQDYLAYREIGYGLDPNGSLEDQINIFKTPFFIWSNESAKDLVDVNTLELSQNPIISANYLGAMVLEMIGNADVTPFISYVNDLRKEIPIIARKTYLINNEYVTEIPAELNEKVEDYIKWQYYKIKKEKIE